MRGGDGVHNGYGIFIRRIGLKTSRRRVTVVLIFRRQAVRVTQNYEIDSLRGSLKRFSFRQHALSCGVPIHIKPTELVQRLFCVTHNRQTINVRRGSVTTVKTGKKIVVILLLLRWLVVVVTIKHGYTIF